MTLADEIRNQADKGSSADDIGKGLKIHRRPLLSLLRRCDEEIKAFTASGTGTSKDQAWIGIKFQCQDMGNAADAYAEEIQAVIVTHENSVDSIDDG